ncbi:MAG: hypothetical protein KAI67_06110 [Candidatus Pacebacteria bacterium]|nr:hypothetical protein [Candidatus Paceibacterota bacterium]
MKKIEKYIFIIFIFTIFILSSQTLYAMELSYFDKDVAQVFAEAAKALLSFVGGLSVLFLILGGIVYIYSGSNPEGQKKAKKIITYTLIGSIFSLLSYGIIFISSDVSSDTAIYISNASVSPTSGIPGSTFTITTNITAYSGVDSATTFASIQSPNEIVVASVLLRDNGIAPDLVSGDGKYTADWTSGAAGSYFVDISACDVDANCAEAEDI